MNPDYLNDLNDMQREAVTYTDGPQLVIAGAGSGKTRVLTYKILHLLAHGMEPWRILALTFTNKAAREMRQRICSLVGEKPAAKIWMGTFHSIFARILRINASRLPQGFTGSFTIYDSADSRTLLKMIIREMSLDEKIYKPASVAAAISWAKNSLISPDDYAADPRLIRADSDARRPLIHAIYHAYTERCRVANAMDFDDLLFHTHSLLRDNPDVRNHYAEFFSYVLVDEYQDTNYAQHCIITQLCGDHGRLMVVGDDAQSIYSFRGAVIENILRLDHTYKNLRTFKLEQNYRSTQTITNAANSLIAKNLAQIPKKVFSRNETGDRIELVQAHSDYEESYLVANRIGRLRSDTGCSYQEIAVLYRTNAQSRVLEEALRKQAIPYRIYGGLSFYQRKEVKDAVSYFRLSVNPDDDEALRRIINVPPRGIGETTMQRLTHAAITHGVSLWRVICHPDKYAADLKKLPWAKLQAFAGMTKAFIQASEQGADAATLAKKILTDTGMVAQYQHERTPESISRIENLQELLAGTMQFVELRRQEGEEDLSMATFLTEVSLATDQDITDAAEDAADAADQQKVTLMTVHAAKGLEFTNVFIVGVEEDLFPNNLHATSAAAIEEERRLLYVAITRAKRFCMLSYAASRFRNGSTCTCHPSRFLMDIDGHYLRPMAGTSLAARGSQGQGRYTRSCTPAYPAARTSARPSAMRAGHPVPLATISQPGATGPSSRPAAAAAPTAAGGTTHTLDELAVGMKICHNIFGEGIITALDTSTADPRIKVDFRGSPTKTLMLRYARFNIL